MKKFLVVLYFFIGLIIIQSTASAGMIRIADVGADRLIAQVQSALSSKGLQNKLRITEVWRSRDMDIVNDHLYG